jgi:hypothetical protein
LIDGRGKAGLLTDQADSCEVYQTVQG